MTTKEILKVLEDAYENCCDIYWKELEPIIVELRRREQSPVAQRLDAMIGEALKHFTSEDDLGRTLNVLLDNLHQLRDELP